MRCMIRLFLLAAFVGLVATAARDDLGAVGMPDESTPPVRRWDFNRTGDMEGWKASPSVTAVVMGGALWMKLISPMRDPTQLMTPKYQVYGPHGFGYDDQEYDLASPAGSGDSRQHREESSHADYQSFSGDGRLRDVAHPRASGGLCRLCPFYDEARLERMAGSDLPY